MSIARIDEAKLLAFGMDRQTVQALRHLIQQVGDKTAGTTLPEVAALVGQVPTLIAQTAVLPSLIMQVAGLPAIAAQAALVPVLTAKVAVLDLQASMLVDVVSSSATNSVLITLPVPQTLAAGATFSGRIIGSTANGVVPGTLNLWLKIGAIKVLTHSFTTPAQPGTNKGFAADFTVTFRSATSAQVGGVLSLAYNTPTVLPASNLQTVSDTTMFTLGMNWTAADTANIATAKIAVIGANKL